MTIRSYDLKSEYQLTSFTLANPSYLEGIKSKQWNNSMAKKRKKKKKQKNKTLIGFSLLRMTRPYWICCFSSKSRTYCSRSRSSSLVEPSMSVKKNVTVPEGVSRSKDLLSKEGSISISFEKNLCFLALQINPT